MGLPRFFRTPEHKRFHYEPIYYDERKERLEERIKHIEQEYGIEHGDQHVRSIGKGSFAGYYGRNQLRNRRTGNSY